MPMELYYDLHEGDGPYLLLVHGLISSRAQWMLNLDALAEVSQPVVVELWGHGRSPTPGAPEHYHPDAYVAAFERLRERLGVEQWHICGQSFGAALTLHYALVCPERVTAQAFTNSTSALADRAWIENMRTVGEQLAHAIEEGGQAGLEHMPIHPKNAKSLPSEVKEALVADSVLHTPTGIAHAFRYTTPVSSVRDRAHENRVPTLLVCGEREKRFAPHREFAERHIPYLETVDLDAGHAVNIEAAAGFNAAVADFMRRST